MRLDAVVRKSRPRARWTPWARAVLRLRLRRADRLRQSWFSPSSRWKVPSERQLQAVARHTNRRLAIAWGSTCAVRMVTRSYGPG